MSKHAKPHPLVFLPALACDARLFSYLAPNLPEAEIICPNYCENHSVEELAIAVLANAPPRFALAGVSMGGYVALEMIRLAPERITHVAFISTNARADTAVQSAKRRKQIQLAKNGGLSKLVAAQLSLLLACPRPETQQLVRQMFVETGAERFANQQTAIMHRRNLLNALAKIKISTAIVHGTNDKITPSTHMQEIAEQIEEAKFYCFENCGHLIPLDAPDQLAQSLRAMLRN
ncbi:alpha/beta fold hydrolase [Polycladidibacter hongkongensis]|uniref:alpha/beta fold hydrolase n=1 Tax=Polycladidibacter hongkongensis TaxID=1647556 RepID=UPI00082B6203|nr:alpha/beta hydrolase [Pseudovibrio hongkongensis]